MDMFNKKVATKGGKLIRSVGKIWEIFFIWSEELWSAYHLQGFETSQSVLSECLRTLL